MPSFQSACRAASIRCSTRSGPVSQVMEIATNPVASIGGWTQSEQGDRTPAGKGIMEDGDDVNGGVSINGVYQPP
jgi:hypothetical protein